MRKFINIMEAITSESLVDHIAMMVGEGHHEGFSPYWKLHADERLLDDHAAMLHISELISAGFTSGHHPTWDLKVVEHDAGIRNAGYSHMTPMDDHPVVNSAAGEKALANRIHGLDEDDESPADLASPATVLAHGLKTHGVVAVHQREGEGNGWFECPDEHAETFVVEDHEGNPVDSWPDRNSAEAHAHSLNNPILDEDTEETMFMSDPDHKVEVAAIHERGHVQDEAFKELAHRGIRLNDHQLKLADRPQ